MPFSLHSGHRRNLAPPPSETSSASPSWRSSSLSTYTLQLPEHASQSTNPHVPARLARRAGLALAPGQPGRQLPRLVQPLELLGAAHELPVDEQAGEEDGRGPALGALVVEEEAGELVPECAVHGHVALVHAHAVALEDGARQAAGLVRGAHAAERREVEHRPARRRLAAARIRILLDAAVRRGRRGFGRGQRRDLGGRGGVLTRRRDDRREREGVAAERRGQQRRVLLEAGHERPLVDVLGLVRRRNGRRARRKPRGRGRSRRGGGLHRPRHGLPVELEGAERGRREPHHVGADVAGAPCGERLAARQRQRRRAVPEVVPGLPGAGAPHGAFSILPGQRQQRLIDNLSSKLWTG
jgi:hypothetical protein